MEHTKGELEVTAIDGGWTGVKTVEGELLFKLHLDNEANAERLVKCWNEHDKLQERCMSFVTEEHFKNKEIRRLFADNKALEQAGNKFKAKADMHGELVTACKRVLRLSQEWHVKKGISGDAFAYTQNVVDMLKSVIEKASS